jgi:hypothetical protein
MNREVLRKARRAKAVAHLRAGRRGPERSVTPAVVKRVAARFALGVPLRYALVLEEPRITPGAFEKALQRDPKLSAHMHKAKAQFLFDSCKRLTAHPETANLRWLLTRRFPELFAEVAPARAANDDAATSVLAGILQSSREIARQQAG